MLVGIACGHFRWVSESVARWLMTMIAAFGYATVSLLSIWITPLEPSHAVLPIANTVQMSAFALLGMFVASRFLTKDRQEQGLFAINTSVPNTGFTMGGFVIYLLFGEAGLGLANVHAITFTPMVVLLAYPVARSVTSAGGTSILALLAKSVFDWRSLGLPMAILGVLLSISHIPRPAFISDWHVTDVLMYVLNIAAYFAIGLRLRLERVMPLWRLILGLGVTRFGFGLAFGLLSVWLVSLTPWALSDTGRAVLLIESFVPTGVTSVAVANMFGFKASEASVLFVMNTLMYLLVVLPFVFWVF